MRRGRAPNRDNGAGGDWTWSSWNPVDRWPLAEQMLSAGVFWNDEFHLCIGYRADLHVGIGLDSVIGKALVVPLLLHRNSAAIGIPNLELRKGLQQLGIVGNEYEARGRLTAHRIGSAQADLIAFNQ